MLADTHMFRELLWPRFMPMVPASDCMLWGCTSTVPILREHKPEFYMLDTKIEPFSECVRALRLCHLSRGNTLVARPVRLNYSNIYLPGAFNLNIQF